MARDLSGRFAKGAGGRVRGSRNKLSADFISAMAKDFEEHGSDVIRIVRTEEPATWLKIVASMLPKELDINDSRLKDVSDEELDLLIEIAKQRLSARGDVAGADSGEGQAIN